MERDPILTNSILSHSIELLTIPQIALSVYRRLLTHKKPTTQRHDATQIHPDHELAPGNFYHPQAR
jgi:hypothetical protein